jgi:hypothetical protein
MGMGINMVVSPRLIFFLWCDDDVNVVVVGVQYGGSQGGEISGG